MQSLNWCQFNSISSLSGLVRLSARFCEWSDQDIEANFVPPETLRDINFTAGRNLTGASLRCVMSNAPARCELAGRGKRRLAMALVDTSLEYMRKTWFRVRGNASRVIGSSGSKLVGTVHVCRAL